MHNNSVSIEGSPASNLTSVVGNDSTSIHLTWTPPSPLGDTTGYRISYTTGGGVSDSVYVSGGSTDNYTLTGLGSGEVYNISIVGTSEHFFSESVLLDHNRLSGYHFNVAKYKLEVYCTPRTWRGEKEGEWWWCLPSRGGKNSCTFDYCGYNGYTDSGLLQMVCSSHSLLPG